MRYGVVVPSYGRFGDPELVMRLVRAVEVLGYESAWFADHVVIPDYATDWLPPPQLDALTCCGAGLGATTRLRVGTDVLVAPYRHPLLLAKTAATADQLGGGRLTLGIGVGYLEGEFAALGVPYGERGAITDECLRVLRHVWTERGPVSFHGTHVRFDAVHLGVTPAQPGGVPLWVGGNIPRAQARAARLGDGWHPLWPQPDAYAAARRRILELRAHDGVDRPFVFSMSCPSGAVLDAPRDRWDEARPARPARAEYAYAPPVPRAPDGRPRFTGTPDQLAADVTTYADAGVEHLVLRFWTSARRDMIVDQLEEQMARFAREVAPLVG